MSDDQIAQDDLRDMSVQDDPDYQPPEPTFDVNEIPEERLEPVAIPDQEKD